MSPFASYLVRRLAQLVPTILFVAIGNFVLVRLAPGDLADVLAGESGAATPEYMAQLRSEFGLDQPLWAQFLAYMNRLAHLNLGYSFRYHQDVLDLIGSRVAATLLLALTAITIALILGVVFGILASRFRGSLLDELISVIATIGFSVPLFWVGLMGVVLFSVKLNWLPIGGMWTIGGQQTGWYGNVVDVGRHLVLPAATLSIFFMAIYSRITRSAMLEVSQLDFVRTARAKGISETRIVVRHILRNALLPIVTLTGLQLGTLLGGSIVIETVFAWPGLGRLAFDAVAGRDINLLLGIFLCNSILVVVMNLIVDILYGVLDPRVELA